MNNRFLILYLLITVMISGCGDTGNGFKPPVKEAEELVIEGWEKFSYRGYANALEKFKEAITLNADYADAYNGAGWSNARLTMLTDAINYFTQCLAIDRNFTDAQAGMAFVYNAQKSYQASIDQANSALTGNPAWSFGHDQSLSYLDLRVILAENYFALGNFTGSLNQVRLLNPSFTSDVNSFEGKTALAEEIERLRGIV